MKLNFWEWFTSKWETLTSKTLIWLSTRDGEEGISTEDFNIAVSLIREAEVNIGTGSERRVWVMEQLNKLLKFAGQHLVELLFWTALNFASKKGWINLGEANGPD